GAGGMGEVYRARDTRLGRDVAVKVLPAEFAADRNRIARFEQEARAASALDHPNVISIFDIGSADETVYIAMTLVDGRSLRDAMDSGPIPVKKLLDVAAQIADGLAKAHATGIVHRDLKPENVMLSRDGFVKILDFGLAKLVRPEAEGVSSIPTAAPSDTAPGVVMGTIEYMSPEQAGGGTVDFRSDQFSLGTIVYEMATGKKPFSRKTAAETLVAILREEPEPVGIGNPALPGAIRDIVERCLAKDPEERYGSTKDLARDLRNLLARLSGSIASPTLPGALAKATRTPAGKNPAVTAALLLLGLALGAAGYRLLAGAGTRPGTAPSFRRVTFQRGNILHARFAPDGQTIVYSAAWEDRSTDVFTTAVDGTESRSLGFGNDDLAAVSADGGLLLNRRKTNLRAAIGIGTLASAPLAGGAARDLVESVHGGDWFPGGTVAVWKHISFDHDALEFPAGTRRLDGVSSAPRVSRDGTRIAVGRGTRDTEEIDVLDRSGKLLWALKTAPDGLAWHPSGEIWYSRSAGDGPGLFAASRGNPPRTILRSAGWILHDIAPDGRLLLERAIARQAVRIREGGEAREREMSWLDGSTLAGVTADGRTILFSETSEAGGRRGGVYSRATDGSPAVRLADGTAMAFSEDGRWAFVRSTDVPPRYSFVPSGAGETKLVDFGGEHVESAIFLPGTEPRLVATVGDSPDRGRLELVTASGRRPLGISPGFYPNMAATSPDGGSIAFATGPKEIALCGLDRAACRRISMKGGADQPIQWSGDGRYLYLRDLEAIPSHVVRFEIADGTEAAWLTLGPEDLARYIGIGAIFLSRDGREYAYNAREVLDSALFVVEGLR
ncbi:MAG TPA: protein kinase, partial [Thermoanaerobaculia bacterium]|nr:protein kinase [Thermoanaerobaculia bacterium]